MRTLAVQLRLDWSEMDLFGHINNVAYFKYLQAARVHFWEEMGLLQNGKPGQVGPMLASAKCVYALRFLPKRKTFFKQGASQLS